MKSFILHGVALAAVGQAALAMEPADYIYTPAIGYGEREIDFKAGNATGPGAARAASLGFGYGAGERWFTEVYAKYQGQPGGPWAFDAYEWENRWLLTEPGRYPVDLGFVLEIERPRDRSEGYPVRFGPLLQTDFGRLELNANLLFQRNYRADVPNDLTAAYQLQLKYRYRPEFEFGLQAFAEVGKWDHWDPAGQRTTRLGPAVFGRLKLSGRQAIRYNAAYLFGDSPAAPDHLFRMQVEYEF